MRRTFGLSLLTMAIAFGLTALANEKPTTEFQNIMKSNAATNGAMGLRAHITAKDYDAIAKDAATTHRSARKFLMLFIGSAPPSLPSPARARRKEPAFAHPTVLSKTRGSVYPI